MCRITGFWDFNPANYNLENTIVKMNDTLAHGGPDDSGVYWDTKRGLALGQRRLAILDLSPAGHQPMFSDNGKISLVFNGEIYNFQEIQSELRQSGFSFHSHSDTEVIIKSYQKWGIGCLRKFRGMFAFALFDQNKETLFLVRDRLGVKPLYYYHKDNLFTFSSETRALLEHPRFTKAIDPNGVAFYFKMGYIPSPYSIWQKVYKVPPGYFLEIPSDQQLVLKKYWDVADYYSKKSNSASVIGEAEAAEHLEKILIDSFKLRMVSDVPVGVFLSGGIDSSIVSAILQKTLNHPLRTFTIGFDDKEFNEAGHARKIAQYLGAKHTEFFCGEKEAIEIVPQLPEIYDEPFGDSSAVPTFLISKMARQEVKVILSGDGGDEFFGGYDKYWMLAPHFIFQNNWPLPVGAGEWLLTLLGREEFYRLNKKMQILQGQTVFERFASVASCLLDNHLDKLLLSMKKEEFARLIKGEFALPSGLANLDTVSWWMLFDTKFYLPEDILTKVDRASMHNALEAREPLLDHKIIEFMAPLPTGLKVRDGSGKYLLKKVLEKYLPKEYWDRPKQGFSMPMKKWLLGELKPLVEEFLSARVLKEVGVLDPEYVLNFKQFFFANKNSNPYKLWYLLVFQMWAKRWL